MTTKAMFLFTMRGGSHMIGRLLTGFPQFLMSEVRERMPEIMGPDKLIYAATQPPHVCPIYSMRSCQNISQVFCSPSEFSYQAFLSYIGDGGAGTEPANRLAWSPADVSKYTSQLKAQGDDLKIVHSIRDGRNQLASLKKQEGGERGWPDSRWQNTIQTFKFRARAALDSAKQHANYKLLKFEDIVLEPQKKIQEIVDFTGIPLDLDGKIAECLEVLTPNSSYKQEYGTYQQFLESFKKTDILNRWQTLDQRERQYMHNVAGQELIELGYVRDASWIKE